MRLNLEWVAPWLHGKPIRTWVWHHHGSRCGIIQGGWDAGCVIIGLHIHLTTDSKWSGIGFSINV